MSGMQPSVEGFCGWLEKQPAKKTFNYQDVEKCAVSQYLKYLGIVGQRKYALKDYYSMVKIAGVPGMVHITFGACAKRARKAMVAA